MSVGPSRRQLLTDSYATRHTVCSAIAEENDMADISWTDRFEDALARGREQQRDILLDFTAAPM